MLPYDLQFNLNIDKKYVIFFKLGLWKNAEHAYLCKCEFDMMPSIDMA